MRKLKFLILGTVVAIVGGFIVYLWLNSSVSSYDQKGISFSYPGDLKPVAPVANTSKRVQFITKVGKQTPLTTVEVIKEVNAVVASNISKKPLIDIQEAIVRKRFKTSPDLFKESKVQRLNIKNREAILAEYIYNDDKNKRNVYATELRVPVDKDVFYITVLSVDAAEQKSTLDLVTSSLIFK